MSGLSLASHPRLAGAGRHRFGANHVVCALALCALVLRARPCGGFACFASCRGAAPLFCAHTSLLAHALWRGRESVCACGAAPVVGVFARWVVGVWCLRYCPCSFGVFACFGVGAVSCVRRLPVWGWWDSVAASAPLPRLACLLACVLTPWCGLVGVCAAGACGVGAWAALLGRDNRVPPHTAWRGLLRSPRGAEERGVACGVLPVC